MIKKRLFWIGGLIVLSIIGQLLLRPSLGQDNAPVDAVADSNHAAGGTWMQDASLEGLAPQTGFVGKFVMMMAVVAGVGLVGWFWVKKLNTPWVGGKTRRLKLVETMPLGGRQAVYLIEADSRRLLVGSGTDGLRLICELAADAVEEVKK